MKHTYTFIYTLFFIAMVCMTVPVFAVDNDTKYHIYTGGRTGSYFNSFGPLLRKVLEDSFFIYRVVQSAGSAENIQQVLDNPNAIGLTQADVLAFMISEEPSIAQNLTILRNDTAFECLFAVTSQENANRLQNWGDVESYARRLTFVTSSELSGSARTIQFLQTLNSNLKRARIRFLSSTDAAITTARRATLINPTIAFFVQFADPDNERFRMINTSDLEFIPVINRAMLRQRIGDNKRVYTPQTVKVSSAGIFNWYIKRVTSACTQLTYITGNPALLPEGSDERLDLEELIEVIRAASVEALRPQEEWFRSFIDDAVELSGTKLEEFLKTVEQAAQRIQN